MPHLQDDMAEQKRIENSGVGTMQGMEISPPRTDELPIKVARPNFLASSDPVVAMAKKVSAAVVESSFDSVGTDSYQSASSPPPGRIVKNVISPSSSIGQITSTTNSSSTVDVQKSNSSPVLTLASARLSHSPLLVKRRVSQSEDEEFSNKTSKDLRSDSPFIAGTGRPSIIRRGSSLVLGKRATKADTGSQKTSQSTPKKVKIEESSGVSAESAKTSSPNNTEHSGAIDAVAAASAMTAMRNKIPVPSAPTSKVKGTATTSGKRQLASTNQHTYTPPHQGFHPSAVVPTTFHPHLHSFAGHAFGPNGTYPMVYPGYPPHVPPSTAPPLMLPQFHGHPVHGFYPYPPAFHPHPLNQRGGQHIPGLVTPHAHIPAATFPPPTKSSGNGTKNLDSKLEQCVNSATTSESGADRKPVSANRCVPLQEPVPSKHWGKAEITKKVVLPDFHRLVNYPAYLSKSRGIATGDSSASKAIVGKKHCVMCGKLRVCSASSLMEKGRAPISSDDGTAHIIPRQNKGLCTACDVTVWVMTDGLEIKWCKGCKNFRQWAAFGEKGSATKCVRCRERQREKYAMQKDAKRARKCTKQGGLKAKGRQEKMARLLPSSSSTNQRVEFVEKKEEPHFAAARGLTSLMNAAARL